MFSSLQSIIVITEDHTYIVTLYHSLILMEHVTTVLTFIIAEYSRKIHYYNSWTVIDCQVEFFIYLSNLNDW